MPHHGSDPLTGVPMASQFLENASLIVEETVQINLRRELVLALKVVIDASCAGIRAATNMIHRRFGETEVGEASEGGVDDLLATVGSFFSREWRHRVLERGSRTRF